MKLSYAPLTEVQLLHCLYHGPRLLQRPDGMALAPAEAKASKPLSLEDAANWVRAAKSFRCYEDDGLMKFDHVNGQAMPVIFDTRSKHVMVALYDARFGAGAASLAIDTARMAFAILATEEGAPRG